MRAKSVGAGTYKVGGLIVQRFTSQVWHVIQPGYDGPALATTMSKASAVNRAVELQNG